MSYLTDLIAKHGVNNVFFYGPASPLHDAIFITYTTSSDEQVPVLFQITEERYKVADDYKIGLRPLVEGFAGKHFYTMDLHSLVDEGRFIILVKSNEVFNEAFVDNISADRVRFYSDAHPARKFCGLKIGKDVRVEAIPTLFYIKQIKNDLVELETDHPDLWAPYYSFKSINNLNQDVGFDMVLIKQDSPKESYEKNRA